MYIKYLTRINNILSFKVCVDYDPYLHLFLWAVLNGMHQMAKFLWEFGKEGMAKALVAIEINNMMREKAKKISNLKDDVLTDLQENSL